MQWIVLIRLILELISQLKAKVEDNPNISAQEVEDHVRGFFSTPSTQQDVGIPQNDWEEFIGLLVPVIQWLIRRFIK